MFYPTTCVRFGTGRPQICLAGFLGSLITTTIGLSRGTLRTVSFQHPGGICLPSVYLRDSTHYSVSARVCHFSVATSLCGRVTEFLPFVHRMRLAAAP